MAHGYAIGTDCSAHMYAYTHGYTQAAPSSVSGSREGRARHANASAHTHIDEHDHTPACTHVCTHVCIDLLTHAFAHVFTHVSTRARAHDGTSHHMHVCAHVCLWGAHWSARGPRAGKAQQAYTHVSSSPHTPHTMPADQDDAHHLPKALLAACCPLPQSCLTIFDPLEGIQ